MQIASEKFNASLNMIRKPDLSRWFRGTCLIGRSHLTGLHGLFSRVHLLQPLPNVLTQKFRVLFVFFISCTQSLAERKGRKQQTNPFSSPSMSPPAGRGSLSTYSATGWTLTPRGKPDVGPIVELSRRRSSFCGRQLRYPRMRK